MKLEELRDAINLHFGAPFLKDDFVKARMIIDPDKEKLLEIRIGRRDIWLNEKGEVTSSGTNMTLDINGNLVDDEHLKPVPEFQK